MSQQSPNRKDTSPMMVAPVHLKGAQIIADCFDVSRDTVTAWAKKGAPLAYVGGKLQGDYHAIFEWLITSKGHTKAKND